MIEFQYRFTLPADYDMEIIHKRVADNGHRFDEFPNLYFKSFLPCQRGK